MPGPIFIDTGAFLALEDESDEHHDEALEFRDLVSIIILSRWVFA